MFIDQNPLKIENDFLIDEIKRFWDTESLGINETKEYKGSFLDEITHDGERYEVGLPWKDSEPEPLPFDYNQALNRLNLLYSWLERDGTILEEDNKIIEEQLKAGIIEMIPSSEQSSEFIKKNEVHYIPHFGIARKERETTKLRIYFQMII